MQAANPRTPGGDEVLIPVMADLGTDHRCHKLAASLRRMGYRPVLLCDRPLHPLGKAWDGFDVRILTPRSHYQGFLSTFLLFLVRLTPILASTRSRLWIVEDLPPLFWTALWGRLRGARVIYDAREIILETPMIRNRPLRRLIWGLWHGAGLALVDTLFAVGPTAKAYYRARYPRKRILQLPNAPFGDPGAPSPGAAENPFPAPPARPAAPAVGYGAAPDPSHEDALREPPAEGRSRLVFQGALRWGTGLQETLRALALSPDRSLDLYGFGPEEEELRALASSLGLTKPGRYPGGGVIFHGVVPFESLHGLLGRYHVGVHMMKPALPGYDLTLANKIFDYVHAEVPVLLGPTTANRDLAARKPVGVVAASLSREDILSALAELERDWEKFREACRLAKAEWRWEAFEENIAAALEGRLGEGREL